MSQKYEKLKFLLKELFSGRSTVAPRAGGVD